MFIDHFSLGVADLARSARFYDAVLATIGAGRLFERPDFICYGTSKNGFFVLNRPDDQSRAVIPNNGFHVCFTAPTKRQFIVFTRSAWPKAAGTTEHLDIACNMLPITMAPS